MEPLIVLVATTSAVFVVRKVLRPKQKAWRLGLAGGLAAMFTVTGGAHFVAMREELVAMVPPALPAPGVLVIITGLLELAGAAGLMWRRTRNAAAAGPGPMLLSMLPANVHLALTGTDLPWIDELGLRTALQLFFLAAEGGVLAGGRRRAARVPGFLRDDVPASVEPVRGTYSY
ncbi:DoxX family protein [Dietzia sp.]|uniref:DoxX family protein n=1 Tax=Dietzia sp. TaxID=1871616 RepID=UPI002FD94D78